MQLRPIKFRAWERDVKQMLIWQDLQMMSLKSLTTLSYLVPMQYTGIKDAEGVEIYEGDYYVMIGTIKLRMEAKPTRTFDEAIRLCNVAEVEWHTTGFNLRPRLRNKEKGEYLLVVGNAFEGIKYPTQISTPVT